MTEERTNADILRSAKARISDQRNFVMGAYAWDRKGRAVDATSSDAARWSPRGAIYAESGTRPLPFKERDRDHTLYRLLDRAAQGVPHFRVGAWALGDVIHECRCLHDVSDNLGHALALQALDGAIALAEEAESRVPA